MRSARAPHALAQARAERVQLGVALEVLGHSADSRAHERLERRMLRDLETRQAVQNHRVVARTEAQHLHHAGDGAHLEQIIEAGLVHLGVSLAHDPDDGALLTDEVFDESHAACAAHVDRDHAGRKDDAVTQRQDRQELHVQRRTALTHHPCL